MAPSESVWALCLARFWGVVKGAQLDTAYKPDLDLLDFCEYVRVSSPFTAEKLMRSSVPLEYASSFATV